MSFLCFFDRQIKIVPSIIIGDKTIIKALPDVLGMDKSGHRYLIANESPMERISTLNTKQSWFSIKVRQYTSFSGADTKGLFSPQFLQ